MAPRSRLQRAPQWRSLLLSCHPGPTAAVTLFMGLLAWGAGNGPATVVLVALAVLTGQLSIGWSNDWIDAGRDRRAGRPDKPAARGDIRVPVLRAAALLAAAATIPLSLALGWRAGLAHLAGVAGGWAYNLALKSTPLSFLPYLVAFGLLPAVATYALPQPLPPPWWALAAGALLGFGAHLANVLPDFESDRLTGIRGLPHRIGRRATALLAPVALLGANAVVVLGPPGPPPVWALTGLAVACLAALAAGVVAVRRERSRLPFPLTILVAGIDVVLLVASGSALR